MINKFIPIKFLFSSLLCFLVFTGQAFALEPSRAELKDFLTILERQCKEYGWKDIKLEGIPWEYYRTTGHKKPLIFAVFGGYKSNCILFLGGVHGD
ncbi:MAG: hypothetical protein CVU52_05520, partial [Deltaproteobacteria bacterium HGW-Deltaproteobacteria-10]